MPTVTCNIDTDDSNWIKGQQVVMAKKLKRRSNMSQADVIHELRVFYEEAQKVMAK